MNVHRVRSAHRHIKTSFSVFSFQRRIPSSFHKQQSKTWHNRKKRLCVYAVYYIKYELFFFFFFLCYLSSFCLFILGTCIDLVNNYTCNCYVGFTGPNCNVTITNCTDDACYPNVTCFENSDSISCGPCPLGLSGDGKNCEGNLAPKWTLSLFVFAS